MRQLTKADCDGPSGPVPPSPTNSSMCKPNIMRQVTKFYDKPSLLEEAGKAVGSGNMVPSSRKRVDVLMIGSGEYTTGFIDNTSSETDKGAGVVALTMIDLRKRGQTGRLGICGVNGKKFPKIRQHMQRSIADVYHHDNFDMSIDTFPQDSEVNAMSYIDALDSFQKGDAVIIFTPDDTHFDIALAAVNKGMHVLVTKPLVKTLYQHQLLHEAAVKNNVLVITEVHKRYDPIYQDARDKMMNQLGPFSYLYSYMSQPKYQLETFKAWAGKSSDISYYLNSHHIDFHEWCVGETARPLTVTALASKGVATNTLDIDCEDTITLTVQWEVLSNTNRVSKTDDTGYMGTAVYTSSWIAPRSDVHSQQRFFYMGAAGEVTVDQAHRGYSW